MATWWIDEPGLMGSANPTDADLESMRASTVRGRADKVRARVSHDEPTKVARQSSHDNDDEPNEQESPHDC
jgi:hypothetical protein